MGRRQFLPLVLELPRRPGLQVRDRLANDLRGLPDGVRAVARGIKPVEQTGERVKRLLPDKVAVLRDRQTGEVPRPPVLFQQHRLRRLRPELFDVGMEPRGQRGLLRLRQLRHIRVQIARQAERQLPAHERRKAAEGIEQPAVQPPGRTLRGKQRRQLLLRHREQIPLALRGRQMVIKSRQDLPLLAHLKVDPAQAVQNPPVLRGQDQVRVAAHDLEDEVLLRGASHLVGAVEGEVQQPLHLRLLHPDQPPARQMLAQQHAEHRRLRRVFRRFIRQVDARMIG